MLFATDRIKRFYFTADYINNYVKIKISVQFMNFNALRLLYNVIIYSEII